MSLSVKHRKDVSVPRLRESDIMLTLVLTAGVGGSRDESVVY